MIGWAADGNSLTLMALLSMGFKFSVFFLTFASSWRKFLSRSTACGWVCPKESIVRMRVLSIWIAVISILTNESKQRTRPAPKMTNYVCQRSYSRLVQASLDDIWWQGTSGNYHIHREECTSTKNDEGPTVHWLAQRETSCQIYRPCYPNVANFEIEIYDRISKIKTTKGHKYYPRCGSDSFW